MRIALAQINSHLGDFESNAEKIIEYVHRALEKHADIVVFPEASLFGYHPMDLLERRSVVDAQTAVLKKLVRRLPKNIIVIFGAITNNPKKSGKPFYNSAIVVSKGKILGKIPKTLLPTYDVFDDARFIEAGDLNKNIFKVSGKRVLVTICEDIWAWAQPGQNVESHYPENPLRKLKPGICDFVVNLSASPFHLEKPKSRLRVVKRTAQHFRCPMVYVNMVGAQDELIFDGGSFAVDQKGKVVSQSLQFQEDLNLVDFGAGLGGQRALIVSKEEQLRQALVLGIRDFVSKNGLKRVHFGLSGGIDSALVACLAADALGPKQVTGIALPGPFSALESLKLAEKLAKNLGIGFYALPITENYNAALASFQGIFGSHQFGLMNENLQSRLRAIMLMAFANLNNSLLLNTSNKSEFATGYSTLYGDLCGGLSVIGDLLKTDVFELARHYNLEHEVIPNDILVRPPSAELRANQRDQDSLPPYDLLDASVIKIVEKTGRAKSEVDHFLLKVLYGSEFKRWQAPPILKVREHSFGRGRRMPVAHRARQ